MSAHNADAPDARERPIGEHVKDNARRAAGVAQENPLGLAVGSIAAGFIVGMLLGGGAQPPRARRRWWHP